MSNRINMRNYDDFMKRLDEETDEFIAEMEEQTHKRTQKLKNTIKDNMVKRIKKEKFDSGGPQ